MPSRAACQWNVYCREDSCEGKRRKKGGERELKVACGSNGASGLAQDQSWIPLGSFLATRHLRPALLKSFWIPSDQYPLSWANTKLTAFPLSWCLLSSSSGYWFTFDDVPNVACCLFVKVTLTGLKFLRCLGALCFFCLSLSSSTLPLSPDKLCHTMLTLRQVFSIFSSMQYYLLSKR